MGVMPVLRAVAVGEPASVAQVDAEIRIVAIVVVGDETYGVQRFVGSFIQALVERQVRVVVIASQAGTAFRACVAAGAEGSLCPTGAPPDFGGVTDALRVAAHTARSVRSLARVLRRVRADAVFVRTACLVPMVAIAARLSGSASFWLLPNLVSDRYPFSANKLAYDLLMRACGMVPIANSRFTRTTLSNFLATSRVAHLGINPDQFDPAAARSLERGTLGIADGDAVIGIFARIVPFKGQKLLIEAMAARAAVCHDLKLLVCGGPTEGAYFQELKQAVVDHGLADRVIFTGPVDDAPAFYGLCDVVASVRLDPEPFGLSVIEGMLMGKPVLVHALGGPAETVADRVTGWHIGGATLEGFATGLDAALSDRPRWAAMGAAARRHGLAHFTHRDATRRILAIVSEHIGERRRISASLLPSKDGGPHEKTE